MAMVSAGLAEIWHIAVAMLTRQTPFVQIIVVAVAVLCVVMTLEGFRTSVIAIWRGHRPPPMLPAKGVNHAAAPLAAPFAPAISKSFSAKPAVNLARKRKPLTANPKAFRTPRPTIRRHPAPFTEFSHSLPNVPLHSHADLRHGV